MLSTGQQNCVLTRSFNAAHSHILHVHLQGEDIPAKSHEDPVPVAMDELLGPEEAFHAYGLQDGPAAVPMGTSSTALDASEAAQARDYAIEYVCHKFVRVCVLHQLMF